MDLSTTGFPISADFIFAWKQKSWSKALIDTLSSSLETHLAIFQKYCMNIKELGKIEVSHTQIWHMQKWEIQ